MAVNNVPLGLPCPVCKKHQSVIFCCVTCWANTDRMHKLDEEQRAAVIMLWTHAELSEGHRALGRELIAREKWEWL